MTGWLRNGTREVVGIVSSDTDLGYVICIQT
jgi:hypothetical protein